MILSRLNVGVTMNNTDLDAVGLRTPELAAIAANVKRVRAEMGWTQADLAGRANMAQGKVSRIERGTLNPTLELLARLAKATGMSLSELVRSPPQSAEPERQP